MTEATASQLVTTESTPLVEAIPLTMRDGCDICGYSDNGPGVLDRFVPISYAFVRVTMPTGDLVLCGHHYAEHEATFVAAGYVIQDERERAGIKIESGFAV